MWDLRGQWDEGRPRYPMEQMESLSTTDRKLQLWEVKPSARISQLMAVLGLSLICLTPAKLSPLSRRTLPLVQTPTTLSDGLH